MYIVYLKTVLALVRKSHNLLTMHLCFECLKMQVLWGLNPLCKHTWGFFDIHLPLRASATLVSLESCTWPVSATCHRAACAHPEP